MARLIRRHSMERLELYDLDKLIPNYHQIRPPLPPSLNKRQDRRPSMNPTHERYQFLCNMTRSRTDPIYAATPMFTTIPQSSQEKTHGQFLDIPIQFERVQPLSSTVSEPIPMGEEKGNFQNDEQEKVNEE